MVYLQICSLRCNSGHYFRTVKDRNWPNYEMKYLEKNEIEIVIQINGRKRSTIKTRRDINDKEILEKIIEDEKINKYLNNKSIFKHIYVKNRLINLIIK